MVHALTGPAATPASRATAPTDGIADRPGTGPWDGRLRWAEAALALAPPEAGCPWSLKRPPLPGHKGLATHRPTAPLSPPCGPAPINWPEGNVETSRMTLRCRGRRARRRFEGKEGWSSRAGHRRWARDPGFPNSIADEEPGGSRATALCAVPAAIDERGPAKSGGAPAPAAGLSRAAPGSIWRPTHGGWRPLPGERFDVGPDWLLISPGCPRRPGFDGPGVASDCSARMAGMPPHPPFRAPNPTLHKGF